MTCNKPKKPDDSGRDFFERQNEFNADVLKRLDAPEEHFGNNIRTLSAELEALATNALAVIDAEGTPGSRILFDEQNGKPIQFDREEFERLTKPLIEFEMSCAYVDYRRI